MKSASLPVSARKRDQRRYQVGVTLIAICATLLTAYLVYYWMTQPEPTLQQRLEQSASQSE